MPAGATIGFITIGRCAISTVQARDAIDGGTTFGRDPPRQLIFAAVAESRASRQRADAEPDDAFKSLRPAAAYGRRLRVVCESGQMAVTRLEPDTDRK